MCNSLKFISEASHLNLLIKLAVHLRWLTAENFQQNYETVKGGCILIGSKNKNTINKLKWLSSDIKFKLLHTGCPIAHGQI